LDDAGLSDPHWSRREAIHFDRCQTEKTVVLVGTSDLSESVVGMLRCLNTDLISVVAAPPREAFRFDEFGCVDTTGWVDHHLPIEDSHLISAGDIADQATAVAESLAECAANFSADEVTVGVTDDSHVGPVEIELRGCGVSTFRHLGWTIPQTAIGRLMDLTATYLQRGTWQALAALVRHADVYALVSKRLIEEGADAGNWLTRLDNLLANHFPVLVRNELPAGATQNDDIARRVGTIVEEWLEVFAAPDQTIAKWSVVINDWLETLYEDRLANDDEPGEEDESPDRTALALESVSRVIQRYADLNDQLDFTVTGGAAIEMLMGRLSDVRVLGKAKPEDVELLGWLDLSLDDAPALVVIGLNHPFVPGSVTSDPFLPGALRSKLRMADNERRYARDVFAMHLMLSSRKSVRFIVGRNGADGSPTPPSRLLAATPAMDSARRVRTLLGGRREPVVVEHQWDEGPEKGLLPIPEFERQSDPSEIVKTMSVTAFRDYLACPYRFYLRHVLKLKPLDDSTSELAANQFGDLVHGSLELFGESDDRDESDRSKIETLLLEYLHQYAAEHYGDTASTAVTLQVAQAERRLKAVAKAQAGRIADGWTIHASEASVDEKGGAGIDVGGKRMGLRGRFDRIDFHKATGRWAIRDYKTHGHKPEKKHLRKTD
jgi:hypothetical protein